MILSASSPASSSGRCRSSTVSPVRECHRRGALRALRAGAQRGPSPGTRREPAHGDQRAGEMSRRLRRADSIIGNLALLDVYGRVARMIREAARERGHRGRGWRGHRQRPAQAEMAAMIGHSARPSPAPSEFRQRGFLEISGKRIVVRSAFLGRASTAERRARAALAGLGTGGSCHYPCRIRSLARARIVGTSNGFSIW